MIPLCEYLNMCTICKKSQPLDVLLTDLDRAIRLHPLTWKVMTLQSGQLLEFDFVNQTLLLDRCISGLFA